MKSLLTKNTIVFLLGMTLLISCSSDDSDDSNPINAVDFTGTIDENSPSGTVIGNVVATSNDNLSYTIASQTPEGALAIDSSTGRLTVADATIFDFETNPEITAEIDILSPTRTQTINATVNLNDGDDIEFVLTTSKAAYNAATDGSWVTITEVEYNGLASHLNEVTKVANSDIEYDQPSSVGSGAFISNLSATANIGYTIPSNSYVFAFKYYARSVMERNKVLLSTESINGTYSPLGSVLPTSTTGDQFYVLKQNRTATNTLGYLGIFFSRDIGIKIKLGNANFLNNGESSLINTPRNDIIILYQGLSTTQMQW